MEPLQQREVIRYDA